MPNEKINVWIIARRFGVHSETWLYRQATGFSSLNPSVVCWKYVNREEFPTSNLTVHELPPGLSASSKLKQWRSKVASIFTGNCFGASKEEKAHLLRYAQKETPKVMLCHYGSIGLLALSAAKALAVPLVVHFHGADISAKLKDRWYLHSLRRSLPHFAACVVVAEYQRETLINLGCDPAKIHIIPCGVPIPNQTTTTKDQELCKFLMVGRLVQKKAPLLTIKAFARCYANHSNINLDIIGDGPLMADAQALVSKLKLGHVVTFKGVRSPQFVVETMRNSSVFLQHSITAENGDMEGWPVSIAEAMSLGLPVVSTRHAGITQQVDEDRNGFLVDENDEAAMSHRMQDLVCNPTLCAQMGISAKTKAIRDFDVIEKISNIEKLLLEISHNAKTTTT